MISAEDFLGPARDQGLSFYTGVPCSFLKPLIDRTANDSRFTYVGAAHEGQAVAVAAGAWFAGTQAAVMCQNSGLGNAINPLTSLNAPFHIPILLIVTWRGEPGFQDEPQHLLMGEITSILLDAIRIGHAHFPRNVGSVVPVLELARASMTTTELPFALVMTRDSVRDEGVRQTTFSPKEPGYRWDLRVHGTRPIRIAILERVLALLPKTAAVIATTGKTGRELFTLDDREQHLYLVGSMGHASGVGLGIALNSARKIVVLDGDGAALMQLGILATIGACAPSNFIHILLDNGVHDSTGGQPTASPLVDFPSAALACGYSSVYSCDSLDKFEVAFQSALTNANGPSLLHTHILPGSLAKLGRPTVRPYEVARRFKSFLTGHRTSARERLLANDRPL